MLHGTRHSDSLGRSNWTASVYRALHSGEAAPGRRGRPVYASRRPQTAPPATQSRRGHAQPFSGSSRPPARRLVQPRRGWPAPAGRRGSPRTPRAASTCISQTADSTARNTESPGSCPAVQRPFRDPARRLVRPRRGWPAPAGRRGRNSENWAWREASCSRHEHDALAEHDAPRDPNPTLPERTPDRRVS